VSTLISHLRDANEQAYNRMQQYKDFDTHQILP